MHEYRHSVDAAQAEQWWHSQDGKEYAEQRPGTARLTVALRA